MKSEKLVIVGSSGLIGKSLFTIAQKYFSSIVCLGSDFVISYEGENRVPTIREDKLGWSDLDIHIDTNTLVINTAWGRNTNGDRNSEIQMEFADREIKLIKKVKGKILNYISLGSIAEIGDSKLKTPNQLINLCQSDSLAEEILKIEKIKLGAALNFYTKQWVTVDELANSFETFKEPKISLVSSAFFTENDPSGHLIETPPILNFIRSSISRE